MRAIPGYFLCLVLGLATFFPARLPVANAQTLVPARTPNDGPDLAMQLQASAASVRANQIVTYTLSVQNVGQNMGNETIRVTDTLPFVLVAYVPPFCSTVVIGPNTVVVCTFSASLPAGSTYIIGDIAVRAPTYATTLTNTAVVTATRIADGNLDNNTATVLTTVTNDVDLYLNAPGEPMIFGGPNPLVYPSTDVTYTILLGNNTGVNVNIAASPRLTFTLPNSATFINATGGNWMCSPSGSFVLCDYGTALNPGAIADELSIGVRNFVTNTQILSATALVWAGDQTDLSLADNIATENIYFDGCNINQPNLIPVSVSTIATVPADGNMYADVLVQLQSNCPGNPLVTASSVLTLTSSRGGLDTISLAPGSVNPTTTGSMVFRVRSRALGTSIYSVQGSTGSYVYGGSNTVAVNFDLLRWFLAFVQR